MNAEIKKKWLEALRSGGYKQGRGQLRTGDKFCCLGVLCDVVAPDSWYQSESTETHKMHGCVTDLPEQVAAAAGVNCNQHVEFNGKRQALTVINDAHRLSSPAIADLIEEQL